MMTGDIPSPSPGGLWPEIKGAPCFWEEEDKPVGKVAGLPPEGLHV